MDILSGLLSIGTFGLSLLGHNKARKASQKQEGDYLRQAELNRQIGAFNANIAEMTGEESVTAIVQETKNLIGKQRVSFANRGIEMTGSPMFILGETFTMGSKRAQEAYFNSQVQKKNFEYSAMGATATANSRAEQSRYESKMQQMNLYGDLFKGAQNLFSWYKTGVSPSTNIFNSW